MTANNHTIAGYVTGQLTLAIQGADPIKLGEGPSDAVVEDQS